MNFTKSIRLADIKAGFIIFLIALPLSIGIALASGAPASAGLFAAIVGGIFGSFLGGAELTINGPAAGLIVVVLGAVETLGQGDPVMGFRYALAAIVAAGVIQIVMGALRLASVGLAFPGAVIHGMLSAIGAIIIAKQLPVVFGVKAEAKSIIGLFFEIPRYIRLLNPEVGFIALASGVLLFLMPRFPVKFVRKIPAPLMVVVAGIALGAYFDLEHEHTVQFWSWKAHINNKLLLNIPDNLRDSVLFPNFGRFFTMANLLAVVSISIVATIESVLSTFAVDKLDPEKRASDLNRDLLSKGICNTVLGMIGGLPIISEIVRSSANIANGAKSRWSNFFHGVFIFGFLLSFPHLLHEIPLAALAAILISVGWRLAHPSQFKHAVHIGPDHIISFIATFLVTIATDLLVGVAAGVVVELVICAVHGVRPQDYLALRFEEAEVNGVLHLKVTSPAVFTNSLRLRTLLQRCLKNRKNVILRFEGSAFIDHTVVDMLDRLRVTFETQKLRLEVVYDSAHEALSDHPLASRKRG